MNFPTLRKVPFIPDTASCILSLRRQMRIQDPELAFSGGGGLLALNSSSQEDESTVGGSGTKVILTYIPKELP